MKRHTLLMATAAMSWICAGTVSAQTVSPRPAEVEPVSQLDEVIVTATRRAENLQDVPIAVTAIGGEQLNAAGVGTTRDLEQVVPGLIVAQTGPATQPTIRGVGTRGTSPGDESNVAIYLDGVYQPAMTSNFFELLNVERIEVLKGPQGTLFGRNATGGAINVITRKPSFVSGSQLLVGYGRYDDFRVSTYLTGAVAETIAADLSLQYGESDGYIDDLIRGGKIGGRQTYSSRGRLRWQPNDRADLTLGLSYVSNKDASSFAVQPVDGNTTGRRPPNQAVLLPGKPRQYVGGVLPEADTEQFDISLQASYQFDGLSLQSTSDYQINENTFSSDSDATTANLGTQFSPYQYNDIWSQELRLVSDAEGRFDWVVGALAFGGDAALDPLISNGTTIIRGRQETLAYAGFGEATWQLTDNLFLTGGLRYSWEEKTYHPFINTALPEISSTYDSWTPRASIRYAVTDKTNVYLTYAQGFKSGLYNATSASTRSVGPETVTSWEVGLKTEPLPWIRANFSAYTYDYSDLQIQARDINTASVILQNAASAKIKGLDADIEMAPSPGMNVRIGLAYMDSEFSSFPLAQVTVPATTNGVPIGGNNQVILDVTGNELVRAPKLTASLGGSYAFDVPGGSLKVGGNASYNDGYFLEVGNRLRQPAFTLINANLSWSFQDDRYTVTAWGENLTSEDVVVYALNSGSGDLFSYRKPATYGVTLRASF